MPLLVVSWLIIFQVTEKALIRVLFFTTKYPTTAVTTIGLPVTKQVPNINGPVDFLAVV